MTHFEAELALFGMLHVISQFRCAASVVGRPALDEFASLMRVYAKGCRRAYRDGHDVFVFPAHAPDAVPWSPAEIEQIERSLSAIFGGRVLLTPEHAPGA